MAGWQTHAQAVLFVVIAYFCRAQYHYSVTVRGRLGSAQRLLYSPSAVHVVTALAPSEGAALAPSVAKLVQQAKGHAGEVVYVGRVLKNLAKSVSVPNETAAAFRAVLVTQWPAIEAFEAFHAEALKPDVGPWAVAWSTPWQRNFALNLLLPVFMYALRFKAALFRRTYDVTTECTKAEFDRFVKRGKEALFEATSEMVDAVAGEQPDAPVMVWNWLQEHSDEQVRARNQEYGLGMMEMLSQSGGGIMEYGTTLSGAGALEHEPWQSFENVAAVHYPDVRFFAGMVRSTWMLEHVQKKAQGDTLALMTVPWEPQ